MEMLEKESPDHEFYHDNLFCQKHAETVAFMQDVTVPWIAFKVLAAGAIWPWEGLKYAFDSGADFVCLGMFDYQVQEDVLITQSVLLGEGHEEAGAVEVAVAAEVFGVA